MCGVVAIRGGGGADWLDFYLPMGALSHTDQRAGAFPCVIATAIFQTEPFRGALIGHEISGDTYAASLNGSVPDQRFIGYVIPHDGRLEYAAANR